MAPFDPLVRDRDRFEHLWDWSYRFEAYIPAAKRERGYYALPILWRDNVIGWVNSSIINDRLMLQIGYVHKAPRSKAYREALEEEASRMAKFLHLPDDKWEFGREHLATSGWYDNKLIRMVGLTVPSQPRYSHNKRLLRDKQPHHLYIPFLRVLSVLCG